MKNFLIFAVIFFLLQSCNPNLEDYEAVDEAISITPDYSDITIPFNIAPLNFYISKEADAYAVKISSANGKDIQINSSSPEIAIPLKKWKKLLLENKGEKLSIEIFLRDQDGWKGYLAINNFISEDAIHPYLAYRLINTQYAYSTVMQFAQRNLETFDEDIIFDNKSTERGCFNCHSFSNYDPDKMSMHFRQAYGGTLIKDGDELVKLNTKTAHTISPFGYVAFNPDGELLAYSNNKFNEYYTNHGSNLNEVTDQRSDIAIYNIKTNVVTTSPKIATENRENFPSWSPDGKFLYYLSADEADQTFDKRFYSYYSLVRIEYDKENNIWGEPDTIYNARKEGRSLTFPRISPDGKYVLFCLIDYGYFSINHKESDLYLMDLETREYEKLSINSEYNDSYHAWSQDGRWVVFSSKRFNHLYSAPHFVYFDETGTFHKPFILPQKNPYFYDSYLKNYNIPEFINAKINLKATQIRDLLYEEGTDVLFDPDVDTSALNIHKEEIIMKESSGSIHDRK